MNKSALRNFSAWARRYLIKNICDRAQFVGVTADKVTPIQAKTASSFMVNGVTFNFPPSTRDNFVEYVKSMESFEDAIEEVAYTWFNRILAIRFMEVNGYLENGIDGENIYVIGSEDEGRKIPDAVAKATKLKYADKEIVYKYQDDEDNAGLFRYILMKQCQELSKWMPDVFEKVSDFTDLLLPDTLLLPGGLIEKLTGDLSAEDFDISAEGNGQVEIFGWMYQFYIAEKKDEVFKSKDKINKGTLPAATQLFTPDWIVRYMVENTLGTIWVSSHSESPLKEDMRYYIDPDPSDDEVNNIIAQIKKDYQSASIRDIKFIDPCCGSGHVLVYAFDIFFKMYLEEGYSPDMIPSIILENNLYGLDVDKRAIQLTSFALTMKARSYNKKLFDDGYHFPNVIDVHESNSVSQSDIDTMAKLLHLTESEKTKLEECMFRFKNAEYYGSLINNFEYTSDEYKQLLEKIASMESKVEFDDFFESNTFYRYYEWITILIKQAQYMSREYDCVVTNPPYLNPSSCGDEMKEYAALYYPNSKADMYAMFIERCKQYANTSGLQGMITMQGWMFIGAFEKLRRKIKETTEIISLLQLGPRAFEDITGEVVQTATWIMSSKRNYDVKGIYFDLTQYNGQDLKRDAYIERKNEFHISLNDIQNIPGIPFAYWAGERMANLFKGEVLKSLADPRKGIVTMKDDLFVRLWSEVDINRICFNARDIADFTARNATFVPIRGGGGYRKWYGNKFNVIKWENNGLQLKNYIKEVSGDHYSRQIFNEDRFFYECISWNSIASKRVCFRYHEEGALFGSSGPSMFPNEHKNYILAFVNSSVAFSLIKLLKQSQNLGPTLVGKLPIIIENEKEISSLSDQCVKLVKKDWDNYEMSWEFKHHPLIGKGLLETIFKDWKCQTESDFAKLKENEESINNYFTSIYGMHNLDNSVDECNVSYRKSDLKRDIKSLMSYAVGCILGRYSLKESGLIYAGGKWEESKYSENFKPCEYGIIPITENQYFEEDLCTRVIDFIKVVYGEDTLNENLKFIAKALKPDSYESPKKIIRDYLFNGFFDNHYQIYQHRPLYWQLDSGKAGGFRAIMYMHRFNENTLSTVRTEYIQELLYKYEDEIRRLQHKLGDAKTTAEKNEVNKQATAIDKKLVECTVYDDLLNHVTSSIQNYVFDLDDGVKTNYAKFLSIDGDKTKNVLTVIKL